MNFKIKDDNFILNDKKIFLNSGEIHYFRIKRKLWDKHLEAAKEAGLCAVSSYVPWAWHEYEEGKFDLTGESLPERDLQGWLQKCSEYGLHCILKPGPFILAETRGAGLPDWFLKKYGDSIRMHNRKGDVVASDGVSLFHPDYLEKATLWYDKIMPFIHENEISAGGPVIMMQVCNEIGVFSWLAHQGDYGEGIRRRFIVFLRSKFNSVSEINRLWGCDYKSFDDVELPPDGRQPFVSRGDRSRDYEWHCFWRAYYGEYLRMLAKMARDRGVTVPFYHNLPGWIYGSGYEFPVNITMYEDLFGDKSEILFGVDHIPEFLSHRNMHDDRIINDITRAMQGNKPLFAAEFQCGSREYHVVTNPRELELFYKASIANGLTGWNYYMFSQGRNPRHRGYSGSTFYWFTPLTPEGERGSLFPLVKRMSGMIKTMESLIVEAKRKADICVLFYPPYYATELERPEDGACGLQFNYASIRRPAYFDGLLRVLQVLNIDFDMADLSQATAETLGKYRQVWAFSTDEMNARDQQVLVDYATSGGNLVIYPMLPDREMTQEPCAILRDSIPPYRDSIPLPGTPSLDKGTPSHTAMTGRDSIPHETIDSPLIDILGYEDIKCANPQMTYDETTLDSAEIIARTIRGTACGFSKPIGQGSITHLGTWMGFDTEGHKPAYEALLKRSGAILRQASSTNENITARERFTDDGRALLFVGNYYNEEQVGSVTYKHPLTWDDISMPYIRESAVWPALYGSLSPICLPLTKGISILHCTSDLLEISQDDNEMTIRLIGDRDLMGEIVFEGENVSRIKSATVDGEPAEIVRDEKRIAFNYRHKHQKEIVLCVSAPPR